MAQERYTVNNVQVVPKDKNPPNTPELHPIEKYWAIVKRNLEKTQKTVGHEKQLKENWRSASNKVDTTAVQNLMEVLHTSASLALNESWDPDVRDDMEMMLNKIVPEGLPYRHSCEGPDDMPAHVKACFLGSSLTIPITDGKLSLGTWQGVWLCEHRDHAGSRKLVITLSGCPRDSARSPLSPVSPIASTSS
ncbi:UPF0047 protein YjbQ-like [Ochlerotatus camptorhynchus]|uniref:UPF0047 protein YjbQ-like n=1 Tax=Ochlerotatus camptorhynchus TaxID=644619 RepID=UPI0031E14524